MSQKQVRPVSKSEKPVQPEERKEKSKTPPPKDEDAAAKGISQGRKTPEDLDKLLDEVDDILEENAEEFVRSYVQRGGE